MKPLNRTLFAILVLALAPFASPAQDAGPPGTGAQGGGSRPAGGTGGAAADAAAQAGTSKQMSPEQQAMMQKWMQAATPGPVHQEMAKLAGSWRLQLTSWHAPGAPPEKSEATAEMKTILGGRYLQEQVKGQGMVPGQDFEGLGISGFDNVTQERFGVWFDNMQTGMVLSRGKCAAGSKKCTLRGKMSDAVAGREVPITEKMTMTDDDHFTFELHGPGPDGKAFKMLEIVYTRQR